MSGVSFRISAPSASASTSAATSRPSASTSNGRSNGHSRSQNYRRYSSGSESSDEDGGLDRRSRKNRDESITAIDERGVRSANTARNEETTQTDIHLHPSSSTAQKKAAPMVILSEPNKDFRRAALDLRAKKKSGRAHFIPSDAGQLTGTDSNGKKRKELTEAEKEFLASNSHVQRIGDKVVQGGIRIRERKEEDGGEMQIDDRADTPVMDAPQTNGHSEMKPIDADALALQELLGDLGETQEGPKVHIIQQAEAHVTEDDAYAIDVATRPDVPTIDDYARVPIDDFGAALLRGMGGGKSALQKRKKVEAYVPKARTALLGIGAKSREEAFGKDYVKEMDKGMSKRDGMKFVPLQKVERPIASGSASPAPGLPSKERRLLGNGDSESRSGSSRKRRDDEEHESGKKKSRRDDYSEDSGEERDRRRRRKEKERAREKEDDRDRQKRRSDKPRERSRSRSRDRKDRKDRDRGRERDDRDRRR